MKEREHSPWIPGVTEAPPHCPCRGPAGYACTLTVGHDGACRAGCGDGSSLAVWQLGEDLDVRDDRSWRCRETASDGRRCALESHEHGAHKSVATVNDEARRVRLEAEVLVSAIRFATAMRSREPSPTGRRHAVERAARQNLRAEAAERLYKAVDELLVEGARVLAEGECQGCEAARRMLAIGVGSASCKHHGDVAHRGNHPGRRARRGVGS